MNTEGDKRSGAGPAAGRGVLTALGLTMVRSVGVRSLSGVASATSDLLLLLRTIRSVATAVKAMLCSER